MKALKISIDMDGTLWSRMTFFRDLMRGMQQSGHQVGILTGHQMDERERDLELMLSRGFPTPDFYFGRTEDFMHLNGAHYKSAIIQREGIDIHFDDCDYANPETERLFSELGQDERIFRVRAVTPIESDRRKIHYE